MPLPAPHAQKGVEGRPERRARFGQTITPGSKIQPAPGDDAVWPMRVELESGISIELNAPAYFLATAREPSEQSAAQVRLYRAAPGHGFDDAIAVATRPAEFGRDATSPPGFVTCA